MHKFQTDKLSQYDLKKGAWGSVVVKELRY